MLIRNRRGQATIEQAILWTAVACGLIFMLTYLQRSVQGGVKGNADSLGSQFSTESVWNSYSKSNSYTDGRGTESASCSEYRHALLDGGTGGTAANQACEAAAATGGTL